MDLFTLFLNFLNQLFSPKKSEPKEPDINSIKPFFIKLTQTEYEAHPDFNYNTNEIFCYNKSDCEDRTMALANHMISKGFKNIKIIHAEWEQDKPGHMALIYNNKVIDATAKTIKEEYIYFNYDYTAYLNEFNFKTIITSPYKGDQ